jgi:starch synthase
MSRKSILMLAAENGALPGAKIGGMGDVLRDLPRALVRRGHRVTVLTPSYGFLARLPGARALGTVSLDFAGARETCRWLEVPSNVEGLHFQLLDHARFAPAGNGRIYHDDGPDAPFATDASKFAYFCAAAAALLAKEKQRPDVVHLHDWHMGLYCLLRHFGPDSARLKPIRTVLTIHNLAMQGIRPLAGFASSLAVWFPGSAFPRAVVADPRYADCVNPLAVAIRLADAVSTVSPSYAMEILEPADAGSGRRGGEGLEALLAARQREGALVGILNGCEYPETTPPRPSWQKLRALMSATLVDWIAAGTQVESAAWLAEKRIASLPGTRPPLLATSIGRLTGQKLALMREALAPGETALDRVLAALGRGHLIVLGNGEGDYEQFLQQAMVRHANLLFLKGYSDALSAALYASGDLFLMPSVFEPCGISQMLAMRAGQPCVVHAVGGLRDTVNEHNGFPFGGATPALQAANFANAVAAAVEEKRTAPPRWRARVEAARRARFDWDDSARRYLSQVYGFGADAAS